MIALFLEGGGIWVRLKLASLDGGAASVGTTDVKVPLQQALSPGCFSDLLQPRRAALLNSHRTLMRCQAGSRSFSCAFYLALLAIDHSHRTVPMMIRVLAKTARIDG